MHVERTAGLPRHSPRVSDRVRLRFEHAACPRRARTENGPRATTVWSYMESRVSHLAPAHIVTPIRRIRIEPYAQSPYAHGGLSRVPLPTGATTAHPQRAKSDCKRVRPAPLEPPKSMKLHPLPDFNRERRENPNRLRQTTPAASAPSTPKPKWGSSSWPVWLRLGPVWIDTSE